MSNAKRCPHQQPPPGIAVFAWSCGICNDAGTRMRALSLTTPYPYLILDLPREHWKTVENRTRCVTSYTGPLLIHASQKCTLEQHEAALDVARKAGVPPELLPEYGSQDRGGIVGCVFVESILPKSSLFDGQHRWKFPNHFGYVLSKRVKLPFRMMRAGQGIFHVDLTQEEERLIREAGIL